MKTIKEAAEALLSRNEITQEEFNSLEKTSAWTTPVINAFKRMSGLASSQEFLAGKMIANKEIASIAGHSDEAANFFHQNKALRMMGRESENEAAMDAAKMLLEQPGTRFGARMEQGLGAIKDKTKNLLGPLAMAGAAAAIGKELVYDPWKENREQEESFKQLHEKTPALEGTDPAMVRDYFDVVKSFSPSMASNPIVAGALVNKMIRFGGVDHKIIQDLAKIQESQGGEGLISKVMEGATKGLTGGGGGD